MPNRRAMSVLNDVVIVFFFYFEKINAVLVWGMMDAS